MWLTERLRVQYLLHHISPLNSRDCRGTVRYKLILTTRLKRSVTVFQGEEETNREAAVTKSCTTGNIKGPLSRAEIV